VCSPSSTETIADRVRSLKENSEFWIWWFWSCRYHEEFERERARERESRENASKKGVSLLLGEEEEKNWS
jgi:hypothetical protein